ncbi:MAG: cytochrome P450 [Vicinamibacterales bacterium]
MGTPFLYNPIAIDTINHPQPVYDEMLAEHPVHWHEQMQCWVVARYDDCRLVLTNHEIYARDWRRVGEELPAFKQSVQSMDPPEQTLLRNLLLNVIKAQPIVDICQRGCELVSRRLAELADADSFDFQREISAPYGLFVVARLLGVPEPNLEEFGRLSEAIARRMDAGLDPSTAEEGDAARHQLYDLVDDWFEQDTTTGVVSVLKAQVAEAGLADHLVRNTVGIVFNAGYSTAYATTGNATLTLLNHPAALARLRDRAIVPSGVEELVRFEGPAQGTSRVATRDTELAGVRIRRGEVVLALFAAANRDPRQFDRPGDLLLDRTPNRHLGFGWGPHACLGALLGQQSLAEYVSCLANLERPLELAGTPRRRRTATLRCLEYLPVRVRK